MPSRECECLGECGTLITNLDEKELAEWDHKTLYLIHNKCPNGPDFDFKLVEERQDFKLYEQSDYYEDDDWDEDTEHLD
ncbi:MAG: hypothetical protein COV29_01345 [Candidatus Yanofskybacteria bacterium CG10_big_fil_rev_8_21_14_0_10_36_16]|uniref:Uncharacterized protein n=1 Tax=Candidatus Yanofskybacteria bacterium CG10_big_fil_rev_8_21_14_0_10_36_16 TaxID=1975096 RepID=A0A2J0Q898_9BACT|nr:MAG: hypothetical protein COV29_01345 [Candidatus Yanofskybacteria bacterium CG10_big_fil_rev_8_21_14_0_10_36_16]